ncbi:hypothetical protein PTSG_06150 [Salpingoeca rosetta]|uniref:SGTA homodimerisation domain-containing protein n=1 Tax=Salpingoeca rosetta (strain ATCC 50818 / BSB-021) TaxID=946362 RepID=F2UC34_SALR5|nr:uncharacterized protein PTSG_06150 [Salpingoeca rosetta]EGD74141.1 hypothetical protein PTSG_06150 [Salpingoeca rosetta]|eukprot:XP_004993042.1 hypothetical protein PTSG_06150 [Salpingoeca rosetta]
MTSQRVDVAAAVCAFLQRAQNNERSTGNADNAASLQVALDCIQQVFPVTAAHLAAAPELEALVTPAERPAVDVDAEALKHKQNGNELMATKDFQGAYDEYTEAIRLKEDAIFYGNRAAACISMERFEAAIEDCKRSLKIDPNYVKSHARMGHAYKALRKFKEALAAYQEATRCDPANQNYKACIAELKGVLGEDAATAQDEEEPAIEEPEEEEGEEQQQQQQQQQGGQDPLASMFGALGGQGSSPGGLDFGSLLSNPAVMSMASSVMSNPDMQQMLGGFMANMQQPQQQQPGNNNSNNNESNGESNGEEEQHHHYFS